MQCFIQFLSASARQGMHILCWCLLRDFVREPGQEGALYSLASFKQFSYLGCDATEYQGLHIPTGRYQVQLRSFSANYGSWCYWPAAAPSLTTTCRNNTFGKRLMPLIGLAPWGVVSRAVPAFVVPTDCFKHFCYKRKNTTFADALRSRQYNLNTK
jgi:hypothetical protein